MFYYTYILFSPSSGKYYVGQSNDVERRLGEHNDIERKSYTSSFAPWTLYFVFKFESRSSAIKLEKYLKKKPRTFICRLKEDEELQSYIYARFES